MNNYQASFIVPKSQENFNKHQWKPGDNTEDFMKKRKVQTQLDYWYEQSLFFSATYYLIVREMK